MKKWLIICITILMAIIAGSIFTYMKATEPLRDAEELALEIAERETDFSGFHDFELFNGEETYFVLKAKNSKKEDVFVWISEQDNKIVTEKANSGVKKDDAIKTLYADRDPQEIISTKLGITRIQKTNRPAWEIYYRSENGNLNYYYVDFETGEKLRAIDNF